MKKREMENKIEELLEKNEFLRNNQIYLAKMLSEVITVLDNKFPSNLWTDEERVKLLFKFFSGKWNFITDEELMDALKDEELYKKLLTRNMD